MTPVIFDPRLHNAPPLHPLRLCMRTFCRGAYLLLSAALFCVLWTITLPSRESGYNRKKMGKFGKRNVRPRYHNADAPIVNQLWNNKYLKN